MTAGVLLTADERYVRDPASRPGLSIWNLDGVHWTDAPLPRRWHRCKAQTCAWEGQMGRVDRCACGAISRGVGPWSERNSSRKGRHSR